MARPLMPLLCTRRAMMVSLLLSLTAGRVWAQDFSATVIAPTNNQFYPSLPASVALEAVVSNAPGGVARVELYARNSLVATVTNPPYTAEWTNAVPGTNVIRAIAYAVEGGIAISPDVRMLVNQPPAATIVAPTNGAWVGLGSNLVVTAAASDPEGAVAVVHHYVNGTRIRSVETPPYSVAVSNLALGEYELVAVAEDAWGLYGTSAPVRVEVIVPDDGVVETFEGGVAPGAWGEFAGALGVDVLATNYGGAVSGTNSLWFGGDDERYAATRSLALRTGATVEFWLRIAGGEDAHWYLAELPDEGVVLEYSNDGGEWKTVAVYDTPAFTNWQRMSVGLPAEALGTNTVLRWRQPLHSGEGYSHWALDDVRVLTGPTPPTVLQAPQALTLTDGETAVFSILCRGSEPMSYQWRANGTNISGATTATLTISNVTLEMSAWHIVVVVSNAFGGVSADVPLTVNRKETRIAVYDHASIVDTTSGGSGAESDNLQAGLSNLANVVVGTFTNLLTAGGTNDILWFPEFENGDLAQSMTAAERQALSSFVGNGGLLVIHGSYAQPARCQNFLNQIFGFSLQISQISTVPHTRTAAAAETAFTIATNSLQSLNGSDAILTTSLPPGAMSIYEASGQSLVAIMPAGKGKVIFLGWDWYDARPYGSLDGGWMQVMQCAVLERAPSGPSAPGLLVHPASQRALAGSPVTFSTSAYGTLPLAFQWQFEGTNLPGATNATLVLSNLAMAQAGNYRVVVTNQYGSITSSNALLEVVELNLETFQVVSLGTNDSQVVDHNALTGDDRSGMAASSSRIFYSGDSSTAHFRLDDLTDGVRMGRVLDGLVSDLRTEQVYCLANGATPIGSGGTVTALLEMDADTGAFTGNQINLSLPVTAASGSGVFAGYGQIVIHNGTRVYTILLPSGDVLDLGAMTMPAHTYTEGWANWGVAEYFNGQIHLVYVQDYRTIARVRVPDGTVTTNSTFTGLSDMASFTVVPGLNRWYFHYEGSGQFGGSSETLGYASATFNYSPVPVPPAIYGQPADRATAIGGVVQIAAAVSGTRPLSLQWQMAGTNLPGATNKTLNFTNVLPEHTGAYQLIASNAFGVVTSAVANLSVVDVGAGMFDDFEPGIDQAQWYGFSGIFGSTVLATNYGSSISPGNALLINNSSSRFAVTRALNTTAGGTISFHLRLANSTASPWELVDLPDKGIVLEYATNGTSWIELGRYDTTNYYVWTWVSEAIPPAAQAPLAQFRWRQLSNSGTTSDHWALDDVLIATGPTPPAIARPPQDVAGALGGTALLAARVNGSGPIHYQWEFEGEDLPGATNAALIVTGLGTNHAGEYRLIASNAFGVVTSAVATVAVVEVGDGIYDSFEPGINQAEWSSFSGTIGTYTIATNFGGAVSPGNSLWLANSGSRYAITRALNTTGGGLIGFYLRFGFGGNPWETVDLPNKGVVLECSTNSGNSWLEIGRYNTADFYDWTCVSTNLPAAARGLAVLFRWRQLSNSGTTSDHWALDEVFIATGPAAPTVYGQPPGITAAIGGSANFSVGVTGSRPFAYQWQLEGVDLPGATNATLELGNLTTNQAGDYRVVVTNAYGAATSAVARLALLDVGAGLFDDFEPGIDPLQWTSFGGAVGSTILATNYGGAVSPGNSLWFGNSGTRLIGTRNVDTSSGGVIAFHLRLANGTASTWETVSLPSQGIVLEYATDGTNWVEMARYNTTNFYAWTQVITNIPTAAQGPAVQFRWRQTNNLSSIYYDHWALDNVIIGTGPAAPAIAAQPYDCAIPEGGQAALSVIASGSVPLSYQWWRDGVEVPGATNAVLAWTNVSGAEAGRYSVLVSNQYGSVASANATLTVFSGGLVGYYCDNNLTSTGSHAVIVKTGLRPVQITNIATFDLNQIHCLMLYENYYGISTPLLNRLPDIQRWVAAGGILIVHDGYPDRQLAVGATSLGVYSTSYTPDLNVTPPNDTMVTRGPFGLLDDTSLDGITSYAYVSSTTLPPGARSILYRATSTNSVIALSYPLGAGQVYYSLLNLDAYYTPSGSETWRVNMTNIYAPNVLVYMHAMALTGRPPKISSQPANQLVAAGTMATTRATVVGELPMSYQWLCYGTNVPGATNAALAIAEMSREQNGLYSVVVSNAYGMVTSSTVVVAVDQGTINTRVPVFGINNTWRYNQTGSNLSTNWRGTTFSDTGWPSGQGLLAYENNSAVTPQIRTTLSLSNGTTRVITYYFRSWANLPAYPGHLSATLVASNLVDDGAVYYLNGVEQGRFLLGSGTISYTTLAQTDAPENVYNMLRFTNSAPLLGTTNLLAVEVHQNAPTSSDIVFGMALYADVVYPRDPPTIQSVPVTNLVVNQGQPFALSITASSLLPLSYRWYLNSQQLGNTQPTISVPGAQPFQTGEYRVVVSNLAGVVTTLVAQVTVVSPPAITQGPVSQDLEVGSTLQLHVAGSGGALNYQWRRGGEPLAGMTNAQLVISNVWPANAGLYDVVVWNPLGTVTSPVAQVTVRGAQVPLPRFVLGQRALSLRFNAPAGMVYQVEATEDFRAWLPLVVLTNLDGSVEFLDFGAGKRPARYYRLRAVP